MPPGSLNGPVKLTIARTSELSHRRTLLLSHYMNTGYKLNYGKWGMDIFGRVDNLFDKEYVGSEIVNAGYNRYYEPAPGRNYGVGLSVSYRFE
ncbi:TonB-dependent receptor [Enterobacter hormaechei]|nr:TonB-dependent receptor [Enterobacter hormaechei]